MSAHASTLAGMTGADTQHLIHRLIAGEAAAAAEVTALAVTSDEPAILIAAALCAPDADALLARAAAVAATPRDRQTLAIAVAFTAGDRDRVDALARDHLVDHPENVLVSWLASRHHSVVNRKDLS